MSAMCRLLFCLRLPPAAPNVFNYTSSINNSTYMLNTNPMAFEGAESFCNDYGGHLVSYGSKAEQMEVRSLTPAA